MGERRAPAWLEQADQYLEKTKSKFRFALVNEGPPPAGYVDLFVYCYRDEEEKAAWTGFLSDKFVLVDGWADVLVKVRRACAGGKKIRCLRIMGHGHSGGFRVGQRSRPDGWIGRSSLYENADVTGKTTPLHNDFASLKQFLDIDKSVVILDHCNTGEGSGTLIRFSKILGGVNVRGFIEKQVWEDSDAQFGQGLYRQCAGDQCHVGVEVVLP